MLNGFVVTFPARKDIIFADCWFGSTNVDNPKRSHFEFRLVESEGVFRAVTLYNLTDVDEIDFDFSYQIDLGPDALFFYNHLTAKCRDCPIDVPWQLNCSRNPYYVEDPEIFFQNKSSLEERELFMW